MLNPLVSVVIPTYNRAEYIGEAIESVLAQTYPNIEVIVIDDESTDNTREIVERYPTIHYVWQKNSERGAARNHGLRLAKGEFIAFLDSDDLWLPEKVESDIAYFREIPSAGIVCTDAIQINADGMHIKVLKANGFSGRVTEKLLENNFVLMATHLMRTELVRGMGGFREERELSGSEDWEMWVRLSTRTKFAYIPKATAKIRTHEANTMTNAEAMHYSMNCAVSVMETSDYLTCDQKTQINKTRAMVSLIDAINYCSTQERRKALAALKNAVKFNSGIVSDARFAYTILRIASNDLVSKVKSKVKRASRS